MCVFVTIDIQQAMRMHPLRLSSVACLVPPYFSAFSKKYHNFPEKKLLNIKCVLIFSTIFSWNISHSMKNSARYYHKCTLHGSSCKHPLFLSYFNQTNFLDSFRKILKYQISWKSVQWEPNSPVRTDRRTDMTRLTVAFRKIVFPFCN